MQVLPFAAHLYLQGEWRLKQKVEHQVTASAETYGRSSAERLCLATCHVVMLCRVPLCQIWQSML